MNICRFCGNYQGKYKLMKYSVRHYAHADCGLKAKGAAFFDCFPDLGRFPFAAAKELGLLDELERRYAKQKEG